MSAVNITGLQETAIKYQKDFKMLVYFVLAEELGKLGINLIQNVQNKITITNFLRKHGIAKPYDAANVGNSSEIAKVEEVTLQVEKAYASVKDSIQNYKTSVVGPDELLGKNKTKKHPWEKTMIQTIIKTFGEDTLDALFPAEYDKADQSPQGMFDGFETKIAAAIVSTAISVANGNLYTSGVITNAVINTLAFDKMLAFYRTSHPHLRKVPSILMCSNEMGDLYDDAYFNRYNKDPKNDEFGRTILSGSNGKCKIVRSPFMNGQRMILTVPGNFYFGMDTMSDAEFVQVRYPYEDPNLVQFWLQADFGTMISSFNEKVFRCNEQVLTATTLSGDYA